MKKIVAVFCLTLAILLMGSFCIVSSAAGGFKTTEKSHTAMIEKGPTKCSPFTVPMLIVDMASGHISIKHGYKGINKVVVSACATGSHSVGDAFRSIQYGDADVVIAGEAAGSKYTKALELGIEIWDGESWDLTIEYDILNITADYLKWNIDYSFIIRINQFK